MTLIRQTHGGESSIKTLSKPPVLSLLGLFLALALAQTPGFLRADTSQAASSGTITRVSISTGGTQTNHHSFGAAISADARYVAFTSRANNLVGGDNNGVWDVFVHDRLTGQTERVSVASSGGEGDGNSLSPDISADGRYVAFESAATTLVAADTDNVADVFVHNRLTGQTVRVSIASDGTQSNGASNKPSISASGRFVAYDSGATNLVTEDLNRKPDVFVHDRDADEDGIYDEFGQVSTVRVSVSSHGVAGNGASGAASISAGGRYVVFASSASNLIGGDGNGFQDIFMHDRDSDGNGVYDQPGGRNTTLLSDAYDGTDADGNSYRPAISFNGGTVVFESLATNLTFVGTAQFIRHVFARDVQAGRTTLVSIASDGSEGNGWSQEVDVSGDGRYVAFASGADNLVTGDTNFSEDIFLHDRDVDQDGYLDETGQVSTVRLNVASDGSPTTNGQSYRPALSDDGRTMAFDSADSTLVSDDTNGAADVFVHDYQSSPQTPGPDLSVTVCCDHFFAILETISEIETWDFPWSSNFVISVINEGPDTAHNVTVDMSSPHEVYSPTQGTCDPGPPGTCDFGTLAVGATASVAVGACCLDIDTSRYYQGTLGIAARVSADEVDPDWTDDSDSASAYWYICRNSSCLLEKFFCILDRDPSPGFHPNSVPLLSGLQVAASFVLHLPLYYDVRDEVLTTPDRQRLTGLYYTHGDEILSLMENDQALWDQGLRALEAWEPNLQALVDGQGSVTIAALQVQAVDDLLTALSAAGSPALQQDIADERARLGNLSDYVGTTMEEARGAIVGSTAYLPLVLRDR